MRPAQAFTPAIVSDRQQRLRARRILVDTAKLGPVDARFHHPDLGYLNAGVQDLSLAGVALALPASALRPGALLSGDRLDDLEIRCGEHLLYRGAARVRRISETDERHLLGVELEGDGLDLAELHRQEARQSFLVRWERFRAQSRAENVMPEFKAYVADLRAELEALRAFLDSEERGLADEDRLTRDETVEQYLVEIRPRIVAAMDTARERLGDLVSGFSEEEHSLHRAYLRAHIVPLFAASPFMKRCFEKPLGYAGDYEMMNMLYRDHAEGDSLFGKALNLYATNEAAALANINRIRFLGEQIRQGVADHPGERVRIASIGCGPAREISALLETTPELGRRLDVALIDQEERSIAYCERTLAPLARATGLRTQFIRESVRRLLTTRQLGAALGERELIYSAGLFDYLSERSFAALLSALWGATSPRGRLVVGNVALNNPSRWTMEYFSEWFLNHRSPDDLRRQAYALTPAARASEVRSEPTGVNLFLVLDR